MRASIQSPKARGARRSPLGLGTAMIIAGALAGGAARADSADGVVKKVLGCHEFSGGDRQRQALDDAIDTVVDEFNFLVRGIARGRLEKANPISQRLCFELHDGALTVSMDTRKYRAATRGTTVKVKGITGDELAMRFDVRDDRVLQIFRGEDGGRVNTYRPTNAGVDMSVRVFSERLPRDVRYGLSYRRKVER